jgi:signal transduction histidine kinase
LPTCRDRLQAAEPDSRRAARPAATARRYNAPDMAPGRILAAALGGAVLLVLCALWIALREPWLGIRLADPAADAAVLIVQEADSAARAAGLLHGDRIVEIRSGGASFRIPPGFMVETPSYFIRYEDYNEFMRGQAQVHAMLLNGRLDLVREDGTAVPVAARSRPATALPASFWLQVGYALLALSVGVTLLAFRPADLAARWFALASLGFFVGTLMRAVYGSRELALDADTFRAIVAAAHAGAFLSTASLLNFVWHFPRRLGSAPVPALVAAFAAIAWIVDTLQWVPTTNLGYRGPILLLFLPLVICASLQWRASRHDPLQRVMARWLILVLLAGPFSVAAGMVVVATGAELTIPRGTQGLSTAVLSYLGMAVLIFRHRAFDLERWWFEAWVWFLSGALVICVDLLLIHALAIQAGTALAISLALCGWLYFPLRQRLLAALGHRRQRDLRELFPDLVRILLAPPGSAPPTEERWDALLARVFEPRAHTRVPEAALQVRIEQSGLRLLVPGVGDGGAIALDYADGGARLFSRHDALLAQGLLDLLRQGASLQEAYVRGAAHERERIARDLHDDIGARLLTLVHETGSERVASLARAALGDMRDIVTGLRARPLALADALADWRAELTGRVLAADCRIEWRQPDPAPPVLLSARQQVNLARILREAASNALRHAQPTRLSVATVTSGGRLQLVLRHDGRFAPVSTWRAGTGLSTLRRRAAELGGEVVWRVEGAELSMQADVPLREAAA